jgi:hypothetical protein
VVRPIDVALELGPKRAFASAIDWPGWSRSGRTDGEALEALAAYADRYRAAIDGSDRSIKGPPSIVSFDVVERIGGDASTDYGVPAGPIRSDAEPLEGAELERWLDLLTAAWQTLARNAPAAHGKRLSTGPRGGGRTVAKMVDHVVESEAGYLSQLDRAKPPKTPRSDPAHERELRETIVESVRRRAAGVMPEMGRRTNPFWTPRYFIRRTAWHALDHAWEIEDRMPA